MLSPEQIAEYHERGFIVVPDLLDHLRATFQPGSAVSYDERFNEVRRARLLVLDDLGTQNATPWAVSHMVSEPLVPSLISVQIKLCDLLVQHNSKTARGSKARRIALRRFSNSSRPMY